jgi:hypothetical protein
MKKLFILLFLSLSLNAFATELPYTIEEVSSYNKVSEGLRPKVLPAITGTIGLVGGVATAAAAGVGTPLVVISGASAGVVYYFYGYGVSRAIDEYLLAKLEKRETGVVDKESTKEKIQDLYDNAVEKKDDLKEKAEDMYDSAKEKTVNLFNSIKHHVKKES